MNYRTIYTHLKASPTPLTIQELKQLSPTSDNLAYTVDYSDGVVGGYWKLNLNEPSEVAGYRIHTLSEDYPKDCWNYFVYTTDSEGT